MPASDKEIDLYVLRKSVLDNGRVGGESKTVEAVAVGLGPRPTVDLTVCGGFR